MTNALCSMKCSSNVDIDQLSHDVTFSHVKLYKGRPRMLTCRIEPGITLQVFPRGSVQLLGGNVLNNHMRIYRDVLLPLFNGHLTLPIIETMTVVCYSGRSFNFSSIMTNAHVMYEVELFPALQVSLWKPVHMTVFHNGKIILTGIKDLRQVQKMCDLLIESFPSLISDT